MESGYDKKNVELVSSIWDNKKRKMKCPKCGGDMVLIQAEPIEDYDNPFVPYDTIIECNSCNFKVRTESFTVLGGVKDFDMRTVQIGSWSPSGSRVLSNYEHVLNYEILKNLKKSGELVEFLVVNNQVVQVIG